jgi:hypothetical protein
MLLPSMKHQYSIVAHSVTRAESGTPLRNRGADNWFVEGAPRCPQRLQIGVGKKTVKA